MDIHHIMLTVLILKNYVKIDLGQMMVVINPAIKMEDVNQIFGVIETEISRNLSLKLHPVS